jgi:dTDP-glucose 4,6-dehydratase
MQNVLITGGAGFIGSNFVRKLLHERPHVRVWNVDALTYAGSQENLRDLPGAERHTFLHGRIGDRALVEGLLRREHIDTVVHFAAETHVDRSILGPAPFVETNILGTFVLLEAARQIWLNEKIVPVNQARFHHISTDEVFGSLSADDPAFSETTPYDPRSPYSASKASSDHLVRAYGHTYGLPVSISNCSNNYGPYQFPEKLIPLVILNALEGKEIPVYGDGRQVRDWLYVEDHCDAILAILERSAAGETYTIGGGNQPANIEIIETICRQLDQRYPDRPAHARLIRSVTDRPGHDRRYAMDYAKIQNALQWKPTHTLAEGLVQTVDWYLAHPEWVGAIRGQPGYAEWMQKNYQARGEAR